MSRSIAYHEATLHMKCIGVKATIPKVCLHTKPEHDNTDKEFQHYLFHTLSVHTSHCMATHWLLQLRFCTYCGAYGRHKSCQLKRPCPSVPSKAGLQALRMLSKDVNPGFRKEHPRGSKTSVLAPRKCSFGKLRRAKEAYKTSRANCKRAQKSYFKH